MNRNAMLVDVSRCIGCKACAVACKQENGLAAGNSRLRVWAKEYISDKVLKYNYPQSCRHCYEPQCRTACPVGAIQRGDTGWVLHDEAKCMGCQVCVTVCPYGGTKIMANGKAGKCSLCEHRLQLGKVPACVAVCPTEARIFGLRENVVREARQRMADLSAQGLNSRLEGIEDKQTLVSYLFPE